MQISHHLMLGTLCTCESLCVGFWTEELLAAVAAAAGERVWVPAGRFTALTLLGLPAHQLFTTDNSSARILALSRHQARCFVSINIAVKHVTSTHMASMLTVLFKTVVDVQVTLQHLAKLNRERPTIAVLPSGKVNEAA